MADRWVAHDNEQALIDVWESHTTSEIFVGVLKVQFARTFRRDIEVGFRRAAQALSSSVTFWRNLQKKTLNHPCGD